MITRAWIKSDCVRYMLQEANDKAPLETGGVLIGYLVEKEIVIVDIVGPGPRAHHALDAFLPDDEWQEKEIAKIYHNSGFQHTYLGDWHTHPGGHHKLSSKDKRTLKLIANYKDARISSPIMAIVCDQNDWQLALWNYQQRWIFGHKTAALETVFY